MKLKYLILSITLSIYSISYTQNKIKGIVGVGSNFSQSFSYNKDFELMPHINLGINYSTKPFDISIIFSYGLLFNPLGSSYYFTHHELGGKLELDFFKNDSRFNPYFSIGIYSEVGKQNYDKLLDPYFLYPTSEPHESTYGWGDFVEYYSKFYVSSPILSFIGLGCNVRLIDNLNLKVGLSYGLQVVYTKHLAWLNVNESSVYERLEDTDRETHYFLHLDAQIGLSYTFSSKKGNKEME